MEPHLNIWIEQNGTVVLSEWRVQLLEAIEQTGSINGAAAVMKITFARAWGKIHEMEEGLGFKLVDTQIGGVGGGGATITANGRKLIRKFRAISQGLDEEIEQRFSAAFG
jgi:molybdate transport system regulatory protein